MAGTAPEARASAPVAGGARLRALIVSTSSVGALLFLAAAALLPAVTVPAWWRVLLYVSLVAAGEAFTVSVRVGSHRVRFGWGEATLVIGLVMLPPPWVVLCTSVAVAIVHVSRRIPASKIMLNAAATTIGATLAVAVGSAIAGTWSTGQALPATNLRGIAGAVVATLAYSLVIDVLVSAAIGLSRGVAVWGVIVGELDQQLAVCTGNIGAALAILAVYAWEPRVLISVPPMLFALHLAYEHRLRAQTERSTWEQLAAATRSLVRLDEQEVAESAIRSATALFRADDVRVIVHRPDGEHLELGGPHRRGRRRDEPWRTGRGPGMILRTPLEDGRSVIGELGLCFDGPVTLTDREHATLATFASALSAALNNARLHQTTRELALLKAHEAAHDSLTGVANRTLLFERGEEALAYMSAGSQVALLLLDLDHFKEVNDTLGHGVGDQLLQAVAERLVASVRRGDTAARLGGDEFALLLTNLPDPQTAITVAANVLASLNDPVIVGGVRLRVEGSIGVACAPSDATSMRELLRCADVAMYQAKTTGSTVERYDADRDGGNVDRLFLVDELQHALDTGELVLHFQPKVDLRTGMPIGAEALARWRHPRRGFLRPAVFMPVVEHCGLVRQFTSTVLRLALSECAKWRAEGVDQSVAVNLSTRNLLDPELPQDVAALLRTFDVPAHRLILEITETVAMSELDVVENVLNALRGLGVQLSVDDFGTGYSSLTFLSRVAVHEVKIDRSFVASMLTAPGDAAIVRATIDLAHSFGLRVIAEGVETAEQQIALAGMGCDGAQGNHVGVPVPAEEIQAVLTDDALAAIPITRLHA